MSMIGNFLRLSPEELAALVADPSRVEGFIYPEGEEHDRSVDVDKAWHGIHFLLTGDSWGGEPLLASIVLGGTEIGDDVGYGPAKYLTADEVRTAAKILSEISPDMFRARYNAVALAANDIYPDIWGEPDDEAAEYLATWYETLRAYYLEAASKGDAMLKYLN